MGNYYLLVALLLGFSSPAKAVTEVLSLEIVKLNTTDKNSIFRIARGSISNGFSLMMACPKPYVVHHRIDNHEEAEKRLHLFVEAGGNIVDTTLDKLVSSVYFGPILKYMQDDNRNIMEIHFPYLDNSGSTSFVDTLRKNGTHLYFLCVMPDSSLPVSLVNDLRYMKGVMQTPFILSVRERIIENLKSMNTALGLFVIDIRGMKKATHGCGSRNTREFTNLTTEDQETGMRSCTIDIMENPDVGFYCRGTVEPSNCFRKLLDSESSREISLPESYGEFTEHTVQSWYFANYNRKEINQVFSGYCRCIDDVTGLVTAKITVMTGMSHVCDISEKLLDNGVQPIIGNWCDVGLLPGSTLTIMLPQPTYILKATEAADGMSNTSEDIIMNSYIIPKDMRTSFLNPVEIQDGLEPQTIYESSRYLLGDALLIDQSHQDEGVITITYQEGRALSYPDVISGFAYIWNLNSTKGGHTKKELSAVINVIPAISYEYQVFGCEPPTASAFPWGDEHTNFKSSVNIYGRTMRICQGYIRDDYYFVLHCPEGQSMVPSDCGKHGYDAALQEVEEWKDLVTRTTSVEENVLMIHAELSDGERSYSRSCSCLDKDGIETARLILHNYHIRNTLHIEYSQNEGSLVTVVPTVNIIDTYIDEEILSEVKEIPFKTPPSHRRHVLFPGTMIQTDCQPEFAILNPTVINEDEAAASATHSQISGNENGVSGAKAKGQSSRSFIADDTALFFPANGDTYVYQPIVKDGVYTLIPVEYSAVIGTSTSGFRAFNNFESNGDKMGSGLYVENPMSSIVVSKFNEPFVNIIYACGKLQKIQDSVANGVSLERDINTESDSDNGDLVIDLETETMEMDTPTHSLSGVAKTQSKMSSDGIEIKAVRSLSIYGIMDILLPSTDPYLRGCGMNDPSEELFSADTVPLLDDAGNTIGCVVDIKDENASFYCPLPYHTEPANCLPASPESYISVKTPGDVGNSHFYVFRNILVSRYNFFNLQGTGKEVFECHCVTTTGLKMSTIRIFA